MTSSNRHYKSTSSDGRQALDNYNAHCIAPELHHYTGLTWSSFQKSAWSSDIHTESSTGETTQDLHEESTLGKSWGSIL